MKQEKDTAKKTGKTAAEMRAENPIAYVTKDRERALGMAESDSYFIISGDGTKDTFELLSDPENIALIKSKKASVLVFKNNSQIEELCKKEGLKLLNPSAALAEKIENKISQVEWLGKAAKLLPAHQILATKDIPWLAGAKVQPFILQWAHSHTGDGTFLISKESELNDLKQKFPDRLAKVTEYIRGPMFTANIVVEKEHLFLGNISYQITGILPFTENPFSTIGNDWSVTHTILTEAHIEEFNTICGIVGAQFQAAGWKGLFGIDIMYDENRDRLFLIELNARQAASTTYESQLQMQLRNLGVAGLTTFEAHLKAVADEKIAELLVIMNDGAQIIQRVTNSVKKVDTTNLSKAGYTIITYNNMKLNSDLARIQINRGIMETHNKLNKRGKEIVELLDSNS